MNIQYMYIDLFLLDRFRVGVGRGSLLIEGGQYSCKLRSPEVEGGVSEQTDTVRAAAGTGK